MIKDAEDKGLITPGKVNWKLSMSKLNSDQGGRIGKPEIWWEEKKT